jgi:ATP-binding cassette subfamily B protein/subfamily B ATP-binding cassette protein MsbA
MITGDDFSDKVGEYAGDDDEFDVEAPPLSVGSLRRTFKLFRYARPYSGVMFLLIATMLIDIGIDLAKPWPLKLVVDNVIGHNRIPHFVTSILPGAGGRHGLLVWASVTTVLIFLISTASSNFYNYFASRTGQEMSLAVAGDVFSRLQRLSLGYHSRHSLGDMIARVTGDAYCVQTLVNDALVPAVEALAMLVAMFFIMWSLEPTLTLVALGVLPFLLVVIRFLASPIKERSREQREMEAKMMSVVEQTLGALPAVQAFTREEIEERRFRRYASRTITAYLRATLAGMWFEVIAGIVTTVGTAGIIYLGGDLAIRGKLTAGTIIVFLSYLGSLYDPLETLTHTAPTIQHASAEADRVLEILETEPAIQDQPDAVDARIDGPISYEHVSFAYEEGRDVLHDVSLTANPGDVVAIVGETGAGKTTLVNLLVRFYDPSSGRITIGGKDIRSFHHRSLRRQIAMVLQEPFIFPMSIADNIAYGRPDASREEIVAAAEAANAHAFIARLPDGYDTRVGERGATLSGGEKQRLSIARAFLKDSPVLILDEPTSALDARTEALLLDALERLMEGRITFVIAHRLSTIRTANQILVVDRGTIVERGDHDDLIARDGIFADLHRRQTEVRKRAAKAVLNAGVPLMAPDPD